MHLSAEHLSAYLDGELTPAEAHEASGHLRDCSACAQALAALSDLDGLIAAPPALACAAAQPFLSAELDRELGAEEAAIAAAHRASCRSCQADVQKWAQATAVLAALPAARPSARVDAAVASLGRKPAARVPRLGGAWAVSMMALVTALSLILVLSLPTGGPTASQRQPDLGALYLASAQQQVLDTSTGTLYVLKGDTVTALDAQTLEQKSVISIGGTPSTLALNVVKGTLVVLDSANKTVTEIDTALTKVTSSTAVAVVGTPTGLQVDTKGNLVVTSVVAPTPGPSAAPAGAGTGVISTIDGDTKQIESVHQVEIAPSIIVIEPNGKRALLVSAKATILADAATYQPLATATGGVSAAFAIGRDDYAILSGNTAGATVTFGRGGASLVLGGKPHAIIALPGGGFAALADSAGRGVISLITVDGGLLATIDAPPNANDLTYDVLAGKFGVIGLSGVANVAMPTALGRGPANPAVSATPLPTAPATPVPSVTPTPQPSQPVVVVAPPRDDDSLVPALSRALWPGTYFVSVGSSQRPVLAASDGARIWYLDEANRVNVLHVLKGGELLQIAALPPSARVSFIAVSPNHVYFVDASTRSVHVLSMSTEQVVSFPLPPTAQVTAIAASPDERLWMASVGSGLISFDPRTNRIQTVPVGDDLSAVATDSLGRVWTASRTRQAVDLWDPLTSRLTERSLKNTGAITALGVDASDAVWVGTDMGETFTLRSTSSGASLVATGVVGRPISGIARDPSGQLYFVSRNDNSVTYGWIRGTGTANTAPATATEPMFDSLGRAWQADPVAGGFYVTLPAGKS